MALSEAEKRRRRFIKAKKEAGGPIWRLASSKYITDHGMFIY